MKVLSIGTDRNIFKEGSDVRARAVEYAGLFEELHIVVFATRITNHESRIKVEQITQNCWVYSTNSWNRWFYIWDAIRLGKRIIHNSKFEIHNSVLTAQDPFECGLVASRITGSFKLPLHIQIHTDFLSHYFLAGSFLNRIRVRIASRVLPKADAIRVVSERIKSSLIAKSYKLKAPPVVLPIFTDLQKFSNIQPAFDLKQKYPQWNFIILMVARLSPEKNVGFALLILKKLLKTYPKTGLVIVGNGPLKNKLERQVWWAGMSKHVAFENWQTDLAPYYKTANLFLQTSLYEGFGLALLEAVASGLPAVSSDVGIAPELLNHNNHSFICPVNDLKCFVSKISELIENNQLRTFFSIQTAPWVILPFSRSKQDYLSAYQASIQSAVT